MTRVKHLILILLLISQARAGEQRSANQPNEPETFFREFVGLSDEQIRDVRSGKAIAIVLSSPASALTMRRSRRHRLRVWPGQILESG
jgi:hypothetical protein